MKKKQLAAFGAIIVIIFTACENPFFPAKKGGNNNAEIPAEVPVVTLNVTPANPYILGEEVTITANAAVNDGGTLSYQWYSNDEDSSEGGEPIPDETGAGYTPSTDDEGTLFYYVQVTNTLNGTSAMAVSGTANVTVYDIGTATAIRSVSVNVTAPVKDGLPPAVAAADGSGYACTAVAWNPAHSPFQGGAAYTVTVTLTAESSHTFTALRTAAINGQAAVVTANNGNTLTLSYTFAQTDARTVSGIAITTQPSKLTYTHGEPLDLAGLAVRLAFDTAETEDIALADFASRNISTVPANGAALSHTDHNGRSVAVSYGGLTANTQNLTVNKAVVSSITFPAAGAITYGAALSTSSLSGGIGGGYFAWADGAIIPTVNNSGYDVEFTPDDAVNCDYSGVSGWNSGTGKVTRTVSVTVNPAPIINVDVTVTAPAKGDAPVTTAATEDTDYTCGAVSWSPAHNPFQGNVRYTAAVTLTAKENYTFAGELDAAINNDDTVVTNNTGAAVTLSLEFDTTLDKIVSGISIKTQPTALVYTHGDTLDLGGLVVTLAFDDSTSEDLTLADFGTYISTHPANGAVLHRLTNNNQPVTVSFGELTADTSNLMVNTKALTVTGAAHTKPYDGTTSANGVSVTLGGIVNNEDVSVAAVSAVYTNAAAGTRTINITAVTLTGMAAGNYTVTLPEGSITVTGGITKANPTVTWPTNLTATYGQILSNISLPGNGTGTPAGTFTWTTPSTSVGSAGTRSFSMTFTPTDTANYNTLTQSVNITVAKANPTVTWPTGLTAAYGQTLSNISLSGKGTSTPAGAFTWTTPSTSVGALGTRSFSMTFTPTDTTNYNTLTQNVSITVGKANPTVTWPTNLTATYGQTLSNISLSGKGTSTPAGAFTWATPSTSVGNAGTRSFSMTFTPTDTANYNTLTQDVSITVNAKPITIATTPSRTLIPFDSTDTQYGTTATFNVSGLIGSDTITVNIASNSYGLSLSNNTGIGSAGSNVTITYNGTAAVTQITPLSVGLTISGNSNYTLSGATVRPTVIDGQAAARAIPVTLANLRTFNTFANTTNGLTRHYKLTGDVGLAAGGPNWTAIGTNTTPFTGSFNGQGHTISHIIIGATADYQGMFASIGIGGVVQNLGLISVSVSGTGLVGGVVGWNEGTVQNCYVSGSVSGSNAPRVGGVVGHNNGTVQNCYAAGSVSDGSYVGGVVGHNNGTVQNCYAAGSVSSRHMSGGVVGYNNGTVQNCYATGSVSGSVGGVGGVVGRNYDTVRNSVALNPSVRISDTSAIGRVMGSNVNNTGTLTNNYARSAGMTVQYNWNGTTGTNKTINAGLTTIDGANTSTYNTQSFWTTASNWYNNAGWDFNNVWQWNSTTNLPILRFMPAGAQNHTVP